MLMLRFLINFYIFDLVVLLSHLYLDQYFSLDASVQIKTKRKPHYLHENNIGEGKID